MQDRLKWEGARRETGCLAMVEWSAAVGTRGVPAERPLRGWKPHEAAPGALGLLLWANAKSCLRKSIGADNQKMHKLATRDKTHIDQ